MCWDGFRAIVKLCQCRLETSEADPVLLQVDVVLGRLETIEADHVLLGLEASKDGNETSYELPGSGPPGVDEHSANGLFLHLEHASNTGTCFPTTLTCYRIVYYLLVTKISSL